MTKPATTAKLALGVLLAALAAALLLQQRALSSARAKQMALLARQRELSSPGPESLPTTDAEAASRREREDLERLRLEVPDLRHRITDVAQQAQAAAAANSSQKASALPATETIRMADARDAGQATPAALVQTILWAVSHGDTNRLAQLLVFDPATDPAVVQGVWADMSKLAEPQAAAKFSEEKGPWEVRLLEESSIGNNDRAIATEEVAKDGSVGNRDRIRVRLTESGWKLAFGTNGSPTIEDQP